MKTTKVMKHFFVMKTLTDFSCHSEGLDVPRNLLQRRRFLADSSPAAQGSLRSARNDKGNRNKVRTVK